MEVIKKERWDAMRHDEQQLLSFVFLADEKKDHPEYGFVLGTIFGMINEKRDFSSSRCAKIFEIMRAMYDSGIEINVATLPPRFVDNKLTETLDEAIKEVTYYGKMGTPTIAGWNEMIQRILKNSRCRRAAQAMADVAPTVADGADDEIGETIEKLVNIEGERTSEDEDAAEQSLSFLRKLYEAAALSDVEKRKNKILFPWRRINELTKGGIKKNAVFVVGGDTSIGKSMFGCNLARSAVAEQGKHVLYVTAEMSEDEVRGRIMSDMTNIDYYKIDNKILDENELGNIDEATCRLHDSGGSLLVRETGWLDEIDHYVRTAAAKGQLDLLIVDHLHIIHTRDKNHLEEMMHISFAMKEFARRYNIAVLALAQLNRNREYRNNGLPTIDSLRDSGTIGNDADGVILLSRVKNEQGDYGAETVADIVKCRNGRTGKVDLLFDGDHQRFTSVNAGAEVQDVGDKKNKEINSLLDF